MSDITTLGTIMVNEALPDRLRKPQHRLDKKGVKKLLDTLVQEQPEDYRRILHDLSQIGRTSVWESGLSVSLVDLATSPARDAILGPLKERISQLRDSDELDEKQRRDAIVDLLIEAAPKIREAVTVESRDRRSPFSTQVDSGARGNPGSLASIKGADLLATDQNDRFIPLPLLHSYAEGFTPAEYFAASYGQRKGQLDVKLAVADAGFLSKKLINAAHRGVVTSDESPTYRLPVGLPVPVSDTESVGSVLSQDVLGYTRGTVVTPEMLADLEDNDIDEILLVSPLAEYTEDGGMSAWAAGRRTRQGFHQVGDNIGIPAAQAVGERLSQGALDSKHTAGVQTRLSKSGFEYLNRLIEAPDTFPESGPLAEADGIVNDIREAPQGGHYVTVGDQRYYAGPDLEVTVKVGDTLEAGDDMTDGTPHPKDLVRLRGLGEARRVYTGLLREALDNSGAHIHRRNLEPVVSGLLNWATVTDPDGIGDNIYSDVVPYGHLIANYKPRETAAEVDVSKSIGQYLEEPVLHFTPGTRITRKVADTLKKWKVHKAFAHPEPPAFEPTMVRGTLSVFHDPDWKTQLSGFYTSKAFERSLHRGAKSDTAGTSYVPALSDAHGFGGELKQTGRYGPPPR
jgi:DNA-directed RNA polymerase subunit beta'